MLALLLRGMQEALGDNLVGVYLRGSLVMGDFDPATSDLDFFAVTQSPTADAEFAALVALHNNLAAHSNPFGAHLEGPYLDRVTTQRFQPGKRYPTIVRGEELAWTEHGTNWILERWVVRERGIALLGPDPQTLIDPISSDDVRAATRARLPDWVDFANTPDDPAWLLPLGHTAYVVETMCRALNTLATGELGTKPQAVAWALATLPEPWRTTVERSQAWRNSQTHDLTVTPEVMRFVRWAAEQGTEG